MLKTIKLHNLGMSYEICKSHLNKPVLKVIYQIPVTEISTEHVREHNQQGLLLKMTG